MMPDPVIAYCGPAAVPEHFWMRWNGDPLLLAALAALALAVGRGHSADARAGWGRSRCWWSSSRRSGAASALFQRGCRTMR
jgi:hypothetical protein